MNAIERKFRLVPIPIRDWFSSDAVDAAILEIDREFGFPETETVLPALLFDVEIGDIPVGNIVNELVASDLALTEPQARQVFERITSKILVPIAPELTAFGIGRAELALPGTREVYSSSVTLPQPADAASRPMPVAPQPVTLPTAAVPAPATPAPVQSQEVRLPQAMPAPVSLYRDALASQTYVPTARIGNLSGSGDLSGTARTAAPSYRPARVDLGMQSTRVDDALKSIFVHRETHPLQEVDYGASHPVAPAMPAPYAPVPLASSAPMPGERFDASPAPMAPVITETVSVPTREAAPAPAEQGGFIDGIMHRIAPWHAAKFGSQNANAVAELADPVPAATVNYSESAEIPSATPAPVTDLPAPPRA